MLGIIIIVCFLISVFVWAVKKLIPEINSFFEEW